jgi:hypothetical protein
MVHTWINENRDNLNHQGEQREESSCLDEMSMGKVGVGCCSHHQSIVSSCESISGKGSIVRRPRNTIHRPLGHLSEGDRMKK